MGWGFEESRDMSGVFILGEEWEEKKRQEKV